MGLFSKSFQEGLCRCNCRIAGADIKDKQPLMDARKSIEKDMERFKVCEREMKMAGRAGAPKPADPKEKAKDDARDWVNNSVESLTAKVSFSQITCIFMWCGKSACQTQVISKKHSSLNNTRFTHHCP